MGVRVLFLIDGFNVYHSINPSNLGSDYNKYKWLNLKQCCHNTLHIIHTQAEITQIHYFTATPQHLQLTNPGRLHRHRLYLRALNSLRNPSIKIHEGKIRQQQVITESNEGKKYVKIWREKGTDIALAMHLIYEAQQDVADQFVIMSGDSDYAPLIHYFRLMFPTKLIRFVFPAGRFSSELQKLAPLSFKLSLDTYKSCQLPDRITLASGKFIYRPIEWT